MMFKNGNLQTIQRFTTRGDVPHDHTVT
jgi:hypothetical protein